MAAEELAAPGGREILGPRGRPLLGNVRDYEKDRVGFLRANHARYGDFFRFDDTSVVVADPDAIRDVHVRTNTDFLSEDAILSGGPAPTGETSPWMRARRPAWKALKPKACLPYGGQITDRFAVALEATAGRPFDPVRVFTDYTGAVLTRICLGRESPRVVAAVERRFDAFMVLMNRSWQRPRWAPDPAMRRAARADQELNTALIEQLLAIRKDLDRGTGAEEQGTGAEEQGTGAEGRGADLASMLLGAAAGQDLTFETVTGFVKGTLLAAHGVPAVTLAWIAHTLAGDPALAARVAEEATPHKDGLADAYAQGRLPFTESLVKEVLRLYPPTWLMGRRAFRDTTLAGHRLRAGETVLFSPYLVQRDPRWWGGTAWRLDPERWLADGTTGGARHKHAYIPFSAGSRVCIGSALGTTLLVLCTARLAAHHAVHTVARDGRSRPVPHFGTMLTPRGPLLRCATPRTDRTGREPR
ncbi:cytochrome P450 [Streptomyces sp. MST-110588]|uniref:cytochrome P450 n=1 Tax=Streptomyces sp. MST-110588 TaxID=2833628 RepID=UPI001F5C44B8|nr:cytochrome P450 [Streptomyces sp. MST-110588]UNO41651.1 cytochrome P450 [Streptomyces sp. MST-110588]